MLPYLLPENRSTAEDYLSSVWIIANQIISGLQYPNDVPYHLTEKFIAYIEHEEDRIRENLKHIKYDIDAVDTVHIVAGGRIEKVSDRLHFSQ